MVKCGESIISFPGQPCTKLHIKHVSGYQSGARQDSYINS